MNLPRLFMSLAIAMMLTAAVCISACSCSDTLEPSPKVTMALALQVELRKQQIEAPTEQRLEQMKSMGMITDSLKTQRVFIYMKDMATPEQEDDLKAMGIRIIPDSWIPPLGESPLGYYIAEMPLDKLKELAARDYIVKIDTAEREASSTCGVK